MPRPRSRIKHEVKVCSKCGGTEGIYYKSLPPHTCAKCKYLEDCPDTELRELCESFERGNQSWGHIGVESYYKAISCFIEGRDRGR